MPLKGLEMKLKRTLLSTLVAAACGLGAAAAQAQISDGVIKIGVLNDQSGMYRDMTGPGSVACVRQAIADWPGRARLQRWRVVVGRPPEPARCRRPTSRGSGSTATAST